MFDLEREKEKYQAYDPEKCPDGLIDISSAKNTLMLDDIRQWCARRQNSVFDNVMSSASCEVGVSNMHPILTTR